MRIAKVVGSVTLSQMHPTFKNCRLRLVIPLDLEQLSEAETVDCLASDPGEVLVAWDQFSAGIGSLVALAEGPEAAQPFYPQVKPVDAAVAALLDTVEIDPETLKRFDRK